MAIGIPLGPALAIIFVGFHDSSLFDSNAKPGVYFRHVHDNFIILGSKLEFDHFQEKVNLLHSAPKLTVEKEQNNILNFLDIVIEKEGT